jgi:peptidoglycan/xylan/chitin deacetylase (PgdA/CDA1 family)
MERLWQALDQGAPLPPKPVVITFDDGYVDAVTTIAPALRRYGWPATFFVITGRVGERAFLTWPQIERLDREGMDVASHTVDHLPLPSLDPSRRAYELTASRRALEAHLGHPVRWFAYPIGPYDAASEQSVREAGYLLAFTTAPGARLTAADAMAEPRVRVHGLGASLSEFAAAVTAAEQGGA